MCLCVRNLETNKVPSNNMWLVGAYENVHCELNINLL